MGCKLTCGSIRILHSRASRLKFKIGRDDYSPLQEKGCCSPPRAPFREGGIGVVPRRDSVPKGAEFLFCADSRSQKSGARSKEKIKSLNAGSRRSATPGRIAEGSLGTVLK